MELLAPAKNAEIAIAAINCGADGVYIGAKKFSAREDAGNSLSDIEKVIAYAHKYYARVYIALNTILRNDELEEAVRLIQRLYDIGPDGLIIQDVGLLECNLPPIPLIASTQMHNDSLEKILFLQNVGFKRVILPREMTLKEVQEIKAKTTIDLECFIHGSLCVSYSGQCHLSYALGGRSANRGACAQPCRHTYTLCDENGKVLVKNKHLLSLKDLNRADHLKALADAGVTTFKIEGRLKDIAYVTNITSFYRQKLDELIDGKHTHKSSSGRVAFGFTPDPFKTFNRGYTDYGMDARNDNIAALNTPKSLGEKIGPVAKVFRDYFTLSSQHDLKNSDGICFFDATGILRGTLINRVQADKIYPDKMYYLEEKLVIYRNYDSAFAKTLERSPCKRRIDISFTLKETADGFELNARDEDGNTAVFALAAKKTLAEKKALAEHSINNQLSKLNDTIFACTDIAADLGNAYFIPLSTLNQLRRGVVENLLAERERNRPRQTGQALVNNAPYPFKTITYLGNCLNEKAEAFYVRHGAKVVELAAEYGMDMGGQKVMTSKYCIRKELKLCGKNPAPLHLIDGEKRKYLLKFDCGKCKMDVFLA